MEKFWERYSTTVYIIKGGFEIMNIEKEKLYLLHKILKIFRKLKINREKK